MHRLGRKNCKQVNSWCTLDFLRVLTFHFHVGYKYCLLSSTWICEWKKTGGHWRYCVFRHVWGSKSIRFAVVLYKPGTHQNTRPSLFPRNCFEDLGKILHVLEKMSAIFFFFFFVPHHKFSGLQWRCCLPPSSLAQKLLQRLIEHWPVLLLRWKSSFFCFNEL